VSRAPRLTHVAFADDCTLIAKTWTSLKRMICTLREALRKRGLSLHPSKCKVQTNSEGWNLRGDVSLDDGFSVDFLPEGECLTVLGTSLALQDVTQHEIRTRVSAGWRLFWSMKPLLLNRGCSLKHRLRLFDSTVGSCVLWCCESWTLRAEDRRHLKTTRRAMLRRIVGAARVTDEEYVSWIRRTTKKAEAMAQSACVRDWIEAHGTSKWSWAGHVSRRPVRSWVWRVTVWRDSDWQSLMLESCTARPLRPSRRRWMKWEDILRRFCTAAGLEQWKSLSQDRSTWAGKADTFSKWFCSE